MNEIDLSMYLVLDANLCKSPEGMVKTALAAVEGGATVVQLRAPEWKKRLQYEAAFALKEALKPYKVPLIIDDHVDIALALGVGVHVGQEDLDATIARQLLGPKQIVGLSVGSFEELRGAPSCIDYIGVGPVFSTRTKKDAGLALGLTELKQIVEESPYPVVAIGGINKGNCREVVMTGANGVAVVSAICGSADPKRATEEIVKAMKDAD